MSHAPYVGTLGAMVPVPHLAGLTEDPQRTGTVKESVSGSLRMYRTRAARRRWSCSLTGDTTDFGTLAELEADQSVPYWMVTCPAQVGNVLTPAASMLQGWTSDFATMTPAGPQPLADGTTAGVSLALSYTVGFYAYSPVVPVVPGQPVTVSVYGRRGSTLAGSLGLEWVDPGTGTPTLADSETFTTPTSGPLERWALTIPTVPAGQVAARLRVRADLIARPALTWTDAPTDWTPGQGAESVVLSPLQASPILATADRSLSSASYTVQELG